MMIKRQIILIGILVTFLASCSRNEDPKGNASATPSAGSRSNTGNGSSPGGRAGTLSISGPNDGGGGTFVKPPNSEILVFWDLFVRDPNFRETQLGDQIQMQTRDKGEWIDYTQLQSFKLFQKRLRLWSVKIPKLVERITNYGRLIREENPLQFDFLILATPMYIQRIDEISVPSRLDISDVTAFPGAYFTPNDLRIFLSIPIFNQAGLVSQAALLLHERMRFIQEFYGINNEELQNIVYTILLRDPNQVSDDELNKIFFAPSYFQSDLVQYPSSVAHESSIVTHSFECQDHSVTCEYWKRNARANATDAVDGLIQKQILQATPAGNILLVTSGQNNEPINHTLPEDSGHADSILNHDNCLRLVQTSGEGLSCHEGVLVGIGELKLNSTMANEFPIQIKARLSNVDGGSIMKIHLRGMEVKIHNQSMTYITFTHNQKAFGDWSSLSQGEHTYVIWFRPRDRKVDVILNDNGQFRLARPLISWDIPRDVDLSPGQIDWTIFSYYSSIYEIRILNAL
jgi:hypothetical protein